MGSMTTNQQLDAGHAATSAGKPVGQKTVGGHDWR